MQNFIDFIHNDPTLNMIESHHVSIFYEPYKGEYGAILTNNPPMFQYGFNYKFYDVSQAAVYNLPSDYNDISFWYGQVVQTFTADYNSPIEHPNHTAFVISQIDEYQPRMCYNNYSVAPKDGTIIEFLDGVPNANVIITPQDSLQINSVNLIQDLQPGLYNIQTNYHDGTSQQTMILKDNN